MTALVLILALKTFPAHAQFYEYQPRDPSVEVNTDALDNTAPPAQAPVAPAPALKLIPPPAETPVAPPPVVAAPAPKPAPVAPQPAPRLIKPFFTAPPAEKETQPEEAPVKKETPKPKPAPVVEDAGPVVKPVQKPMVLPGPEDRKPGTPPPRAAPPEIPSEWQEKPAAAAPPPADTPADKTIAFTGAKSEATPEIQKQLEAVVTRLKDEDGTRLQVRAFAAGEDGNTGSARRISLSRALAVRSYLMDKGIKPNRIDVRALGSETKKTPADRVDLVFVK